MLSYIALITCYAASNHHSKDHRYIVILFACGSTAVIEGRNI